MSPCSLAQVNSISALFSSNDGCEENGKITTDNLDDDDFSSLFHLTTNEIELSDRDQLAVTSLTVLILYFLKKSGYFSTWDSSKQSNLRCRNNHSEISLM